MDGIHTLVGDQGDFDVLKNWIANSNGGFDVIIDDGSHANTHILSSFNLLFHEALLPGGLYFIEDLHVGRLHGPDDRVISDIIQAWIDQLLVPNIYMQDSSLRGHEQNRAVKMRSKHPLPSTIKWIFCQYEACVIAKCDLDMPCKPTYYS